MAKTQTMETTAGRVIFIRTPKRLTPAQLALAMGGFTDDDPRWLAINQILDEELSTRSLEATNPKATDQEMRSATGGMDALATLKARLDAERKKPIAPEKPKRS